MDDEIITYGRAALPGTEYSGIVITDTSRRLDSLFGFNYLHKVLFYHRKLRARTLTVDDIDEPELFRHSRAILAVSQSPVLGITGKIAIPVSREVDRNFRHAMTFMAASRESERVVEHFYDLAKTVGFFFALPYEEAIRAKGGIGRLDAEKAIEEGYALAGTTTLVDGNPLRMLEVSDQFCPLEKRII